MMNLIRGPDAPEAIIEQISKENSQTFSKKGIGSSSIGSSVLKSFDLSELRSKKRE
jgi:hypothetical protein